MDVIGSRDRNNGRGICYVFVALVCSLYFNFSCVTDMKVGEKDINSKEAKVRIEDTEKAIVVRYLNNSEPNKAYVEIKRLFLKYGQDDVSLNNLMGLTQLALNNTNQAMIFFRKAYSKDKNPATGLNISSTYISQKKYVTAIKWINSLRKKFPDYAHYDRYYHNLAVSWEGLSKDNLAISYYKKSMEINPNNYMSTLKLAYLYKRLGNKQKALENFELSSILCELCVEPSREISAYYMKEGNRKKAISTIEQYLSKNEINIKDKKEMMSMMNDIKNKKN